MNKWLPLSLVILISSTPFLNATDFLMLNEDVQKKTLALLTEADLRAIAQVCQHFKYLAEEIRKTRNLVFKTEVISEESVRQLQHYQQIKLYLNNPSEETMQRLGSLSNIRNLMIESKTAPFVESWLVHISHLHQLQWFSLCTKNKEAFSDQNLVYLKNFTQLTRLQINPSYTTDAGLDVLTRFKELEEIRIRWEVKLQAVPHLLKALPKLKEGNICCHSFSWAEGDDLLRKISPHLVKHLLLGFF